VVIHAVISRAEALGRLCRGGFQDQTGSLLSVISYVIEAKKISDPLVKNENIYGPLIALPRIGKKGDIIKVYKLRTMHPYSEYIQDYVYRLYDLQDGGKFKMIFVLHHGGAVCRTIWLDELPRLLTYEGQI